MKIRLFKSRHQLNKFYTFLGVAALIIGLLNTWFIDHTMNPAVFGLRETVDAFSEQLAEQNLDSEQVQARTERFNRVLDEVIQTWPKTHHQPLFNRAAVLSGGRDVTADIQVEISRRMGSNEG